MTEAQERLDYPINLAGGQMTHHYHACALFHKRSERERILFPFLQDGVKNGEKTLHVIAPEQREEVCAHYEGAGNELASALRTGQFEVLTWNDAYLRGGRFEPQAMLSLIDDIAQAATVKGFRRIRMVGHMEWALEDRPGVDQLIEYEARVNATLVRHRIPGVCAYDVTRFRADVLIDVLRVHPIVVIGGNLQENPFFMPPEEFLRELAERRGKTSYRQSAGY